MDAPTKNLMKGIATAVLVAVDAFGLFVFCFLGSIGLFIALFGLEIPPSSVIEDDIIMPIFGIVIGLIVVIPITRLIWQTNQSRWQTTFQSLFFLFLYLISAIVAIFGLMFVTLISGLFADRNLETLKTVCRIASALFALGYYFWFKKIIKPKATEI